ncbi:MAG: PKD domain-containing protein, partial [archaeon]|nr:PKD domain-containing protein [archaeon]
AIDDSGTYSSWVHLFITVNPPNESPVASISISPESLGGLTPEYYQYSTLTFSSHNSNDPDGQIVAYKWWHNNEVVSEESTWISEFSDLTIYQVKLEVRDDSGVWSSKVSANFKIVENTPPTASFDISSEGLSYNFNSTSSDVEGMVTNFEWSVNDVVISSNENTTWLANASGKYEITLMVWDDGGLSSNTTQTIEVVLSASEQKNFVVSFSSKNIEPGDSFTMDFSKTTGDVDHYTVVVNNPNGSRDSYKITIPTADGYNYTLMFPVKGVYTLDITVIWADGIAQDNMADFYGPTVNVGGDGTETTDETALEEVEDSGLPSISLFISLLVTGLIAISRRQR